MAVNIKIDKKGFPVNIGEVSFFFGTSMEELTSFYDKAEHAETEAPKLKKKLESLKVEDEPSKEQATSVMELLNELNVLNYDSLFGTGAYEKLYKKYPDAWQLLEVFDEVSEEVSNALEKELEKQKTNADAEKIKLLKKKTAKKSKAKK